MPLRKKHHLYTEIKIFCIILCSALFFSTTVIPSAQAQSTACPALPSTSGSALYSVTIHSAGLYNFWARVKTDTHFNNSFYLQVNDQCPVVIGDGSLQATSYTWINYKDGAPTAKVQLSLSSGSHVIRLLGKDAGMLIDTFLLTSDLTCIPTDTGGNCSQVVTPTIISSPTPTRTPTPTPAVVPTHTPGPTVTPTANGTQFTVHVLLQGIGKGGDNANPTSTGNMNPLHPQRQIKIELFDELNKKVDEGTGTILFNPSSGTFSGDISLSQRVPNGTYLALLSSPQFLKKRYTQIVSISSNHVILTSMTLIGADTNSDNSLNILDYNLIVGCYSDLLPPVDCDNIKKDKSDITDDGEVNQFDYNFFMRNASTYQGN